MNFSFYIYGTPSGRYNQYPDDYTVPLIKGLQNDLQGARLVIYRDMDLIHYIFTERIDEKMYIGFCLIFNKVRITQPKALIRLFRQLVENNMIKSGDIIKYDTDGNLIFKNKALCDNKKEIEKIKDYIDSELEKNKKRFGFQELHSVYNGVNSRTEIDTLASDSQIIGLTEQYNLVVIDDKVGISNAYIPQLISDFRVRLESAHSQIEKLKGEINLLQKKKKQYKYVVSLFLIVILCCVGLYLFYNEVIHKNDQISKLEKTISIKNDTISSQNNRIDLLDKRVSKLNTTIEHLTEYTLTTGATIRNNDSSDNGWIMWLHANRKVQMESFYVKGGSSSNGEMTLALYDANDNLIATADAYVSSSEFKRICLSSDWVMNSGYYYLRIKNPNGKNLQYHGSSDKEYSQFSGGALEVTGCCSYGDRSKEDKRNSHGYYQYFYNIQYRIVK